MPGVASQEAPNSSAGGRSTSTIQLVLPAYNEAASLPPQERLGKLTRAWDQPMTVRVVDEGSSDGAADIVRRARDGP